jgi:PD-(D/E)XK nuclease superfamily
MNDKANIILDASKVDLFETCPARYNFRHNKNKVLPVIFKSKALDLGGIAHEGLAVYYTLLKDNIPFKERVSECIKKIIEVSSNPEESNSEADDVNSLIKTIEQYLDYWRPEDENCMEILNVETPFAYILYEDDSVRIIISGKIDLLCNWHGIGRSQSYTRLPVDHKTFSRDGEVLRKNNQFINYSKAVGSNYLWVNRIGLQNPSAKNPILSEEKFKRLPLSYDPIYIEDWSKNLTKMILNEYLNCIADDYWPEKPTSCNKFNRKCEYYDICDSSGEDSKALKLETQYVTAPEWDVTKNLVTKDN